MVSEETRDINTPSDLDENSSPGLDNLSDLDENSSSGLDSLSDLDENSTPGLDENPPLGFNENSLSGSDSLLGSNESSLLTLDVDENSPPGLDEMLTQIRCQVDTMVPVDPDPTNLTDLDIDDMPVAPPVSPASISSISDDEELHLTNDVGLNDRSVHDMSVDDMSVVSLSIPSISDDEELYPASMSDKEAQSSGLSVANWDPHKAELETIRDSLESLYIIKDRVGPLLHRLPTQCFIDLVNQRINISNIMNYSSLSDEGAKIIEDAVRAYLNEAIPYTKM